MKRDGAPQAAFGPLLLLTFRFADRGAATGHYAFFYPLSWDRDGLLISAWIDFDVATTSLKALRSFMAHELGHGMGLWDRKTCKKNQTIMNGFPGINRDNGLVSPSDCDLEVVRQVYQQQRQLAMRAPLTPVVSAE